MSVSIGDLRPIGGNSCSVVRITTDQSVSIATRYWKWLQVTLPQISYSKLWSFSKSSYVLPHSRGPNSFGDLVLNIQGSETLFVRIWHLYIYNFGQPYTFCYMDSRMITLIDCYCHLCVNWWFLVFIVGRAETCYFGCSKQDRSRDCATQLSSLAHPVWIKHGVVEAQWCPTIGNLPYSLPAKGVFAIHGQWQSGYSDTAVSWWIHRNWSQGM